MAQERRRFFRWPLSISCVCRSEGVTFTGEAVNLSFGGARIIRPDALPQEGSDLEVILHRKDYSVSMKAHVFYTEMEGERAFGVEFYGPLEERTQKLLPLLRITISEEKAADIQ